MPWSPSWCLTFAFLPWRFALPGQFPKQGTVPYIALYQVDISDSQGQEKTTWTKKPSISQCSPCSIISLWPGRSISLIWKELQDPAIHVKLCLDVAENACANPQEVTAWLESPFLPLRKKYHGSPRVWLPSSAWVIWTAQFLCLQAGSPRTGLAGQPEALQLIACDSEQEQRLPGEHRNRGKQTALLPSLQGCPKEGSLSCLPPGHSAYPSPSHQSSSWTGQIAKEDPRLFCLPLFLRKYVLEREEDDFLCPLLVCGGEHEESQENRCDVEKE